jgi:hypothetical protein
MQPFYYQDDRDVRQPIGMTLREVAECLTPAERRDVLLAFDPAWVPSWCGPTDNDEAAFWKALTHYKRDAGFQNRVFEAYWSGYSK